jgi:phosphoenolpyruvate phosphomutase
MKKTVYFAFSEDLLHEGHKKILKYASKFGDVTVGLLTDSAIIEYKNLPHLSYEQREELIKKISFIKRVVPQETLDYSKNINLLKPDFIVHGDDWRKGIQKTIREKVIKSLKKYKGRLIETKYVKNISLSKINEKKLEVGATPDNRRAKLSRLIKSKKIVRILEAHSALTGLIIENLSVLKNKNFFAFDGMWSSSLTDSTIRGKPDNQSVDYSTRILGLNEILDVTTKPFIFDGDNGGRIEHLPFIIKTLDRLGVSAIILEDKVGLKKNSLFKEQSGVKQDTKKDFSKKISVSKKSTVSKDFMVIARIESFILGKDINDALSRANAYSKAGADAIMIHSKEKNPKQVFSFAKKFRKSKYFKPLVAVPSTYSFTTEKKLIENGFKIVIYANQLLRASHPAMVDVASSILKNGRAYESEKKLSSVSSIIKLIK